MSFLLGAFGKLAAGRRVRSLQARMMRVQTKLRRATRQISTMSKMIETQKKLELNSLTASAGFANSMIGYSIAQNNSNISMEDVKNFSSGITFNSGDMDEAQRGKYALFQQEFSQMKAYNEMALAQMKAQIEEKYENMNDMMLEPLQMEQDSLQTEKDSLESQVQIAQADYEACKKMESADAKNLAPNYTGQG